MNTVCIYHKNCFDGMCSAWVVHKMFPDALLIPMAYGDRLINHDGSPIGLDKRTRLIIVDFSFPRERMIALNQIVGDMIVLDHHKTAQANCEGLGFCKFDMTESGASMAWKHYFPGQELPRLVRYIRDRDLWLFKEFKSDEINAYIQSFPMSLEFYERLHIHLEDDMGYHVAIQGGESIGRYKDTMVEAICKTVGFTAGYPFNNISVPIVNTSMLFSEVGHHLCKKFPKAPFAAYFYDRLGDGVRQWGLRSIGDYDVSMVAKALGGGGHRNAAGFEQNLGAL